MNIHEPQTALHDPEREDDEHEDRMMVEDYALSAGGSATWGRPHPPELARSAKMALLEEIEMPGLCVSAASLHTLSLLTGEDDQGGPHLCPRQ